MARLAITKDVLSAFAKLDKRLQGAVQSAIADFASGRHGAAYLEKVPGSLDDRIRLLRVDAAWYGAVLVPDSGNTYCLLTILPADEAVGYAASHRVGVDQATGLERTPDQVAFVSGQEELRLILAHPFTAWRTFLHPSQREIAYRPSYSGPAQVTGGPGTGKTVAVLHRAAHLAARAASGTAGPAGPGAAEASAPGPDAAPILLTTFNGNLADALQAQLDLLIRDPAVRRQIQVRNVDRLAYSIVTEARGTPVIADERVLRARWAEAAAAFGLELTPAFVKNEWEEVILAQDLHSEHAYLTCLRTGRGRPLTKAQRSRVWQAAQQVMAELATARRTTHLQLANEATHLLREAGAPRYRHILVDEGQDLHSAQWRLLRAAVAEGPDDLFIAADPHQRIYSSRASLASLRISVRGRSRKLSLNYRTTQEILAWAMPLLGSDPVTGLDGEADSLLGYRSPMHGQRPQVRLAATRGEEFGFLSEQIRSWLAVGFEPGAIGVTARSAGLVREARAALKADGLDTTSISVRGGAAGVRAGTMHAMKGLEFQAVAVIGVEEGAVPDPAAITADNEDPVAHAQDLQRERCVLFVACTRARDHLYVSGTGTLSMFLPPCPADLPQPSPARPAAPALSQRARPAEPHPPDHGTVAPHARANRGHEHIHPAQGNDAGTAPPRRRLTGSTAQGRLPRR